MELFPYQKKGVDFTIEALERCGSALLADEMGLGKTAQALTVCRRMRLQVILVVTRNGVKSSWANEVRLWDPDGLPFVVPSGQGVKPTDRTEVVRKAFRARAGERGGPIYVIVHYDALRLMVDELAKHTWDMVIADECQDIKNRKALRTKAIKKIQTRYKLGLSGTPLVNRPDEIWSVLNWFFPTKKQCDLFLGNPYFSGYWKFYEEFIRFKIHPSLGVRIIEGYKNLAELHEILSGFTIRRLKKNELKDLPDKYYTHIPVELGPTQRRVYKQMQNDFMAWLGDQEDTPLLAPSVLAQLTRLRMFADANADVEWIHDEDGVPIDMKIHLIEPSAKLDVLMDLIEDEDKQFVVFTQFRDMVTLIADKLKAAKISFVEYHGGVSEAERDQAIETFQACKAQVFLGTPQAGGVGITLTAADTVVFVDRAWSPSVNLQAEDRLHRIGQKNAVQVIILQAEHTVDVDVENLLRGKWHMIQQVLDGKTRILDVE